MNELGTIEERVLRGATLLDEAWPGWADIVTLRSFNLNDPCRCVLGQLSAHDGADEDFYDAGVERLHDRAPAWDNTDDQGYGFDISYDAPDLAGERDEYAALTRQWRIAIKARKTRTRA